MSFPFSKLLTCSACNFLNFKGKRELSMVIGNQSYNPCAALALTNGEEERRGMVETIWDWFKGYLY